MLKHLHLFKTLFLLLALVAGGETLKAAATEDGTFVIDFYDSSKLTSSSGTGLTNSNYSSFVSVPAGANVSSVVTSVSVTGTVQYGKNGGLTAGTGTAAGVDSHYVTFNIGDAYAVKKCTVYATAYESGRWLLNGNAAASGSLGAKGATIETISTPLIWNFAEGQKTLTFKKDNGLNGNQKRLTIYRIVCEYGSSVAAPSISPADGYTISGNQSVTISHAESKPIYYTIDGTNPTNESTLYSGPFDVSASTVTGQVTVKAVAYDGSKKSTVVSATYTDPSIQPTLFSFELNNTFLGVTVNTNMSGKFETTINNLKFTIDKTSGTWTRGDANCIRIYNHNFVKLEAPDGYNIIGVEFSTAGDWTDPTPSVGSLSSKKWTGEASEVQFDFTATCYVASIEITLERALPLVATLGDLNVTDLEKGAKGTFSTTVNPADGLSASDYTLSWAATPAGLTVAPNGDYTASTRGAYKVTATATSNNPAYKTASKEYDVTVTEKVIVSAEDKIIAIGDAPVAIGATATDGYAGTLTYVSGDGTVATVDASGNITAVAKGTTTITISSPADASHYFTAGDDVVINVSVKGLAGLEYATTSYKVAYGASFPTPTLINPHNLPVTYAKTGDNVATVDPSTGAVTILTGTKGTARITASTVGDAEYAPGSAYYDIKVYDPEAGDGTLAKPFTVEEANEWIAENVASGNTTSETYYVRGIVSSLSASGKKLSDGTQYFFISDDGTETDELGVYYAKYLEKAAFSTTTWVMPGDEVVVCGPLQNYNGNKPYYVDEGDDTFVQSITRKTFADGTLPVNETFASSFGTFTTDGTAVEKSSTSYDVWTIDTSKGYAKATSYISSSNLDAESMLISQMIDATAVSNIQLTFDQCVNKYFGKAGTSTTNANIANEAMVYAKKEGEATWTKLTISSYPAITSGSWSSFETATINLSAYVGYKFQIAFVYRGTSTTAGTWEIKNVVISPTSETVAITDAGLATYASDYALDYTTVEDIEAYIAKEEEGTVKLYQVNKVPAGTGVLLRSTNGGTEFVVPIITAAPDVIGNIFVRGTGAAVESGSGPYNYILNKIDGVLGFYKANGNMVAKNRAYLQTTAPSARIALNFDDETTGIKSMDNGQWTMDNVYDMQGRKVDAPKKGLYIINGRKVVIK